MGDLTKNLSRHEFLCKGGDCPLEAVDFMLVHVIQDAIDWASESLGQKVYAKITSGNRCPKHNKKVGGSKGSKHQYSLAADWYLYLSGGKRVPMKPVYKYLTKKYPGQYGIAYYATPAPGRVHTDTATRVWRRMYA